MIALENLEAPGQPRLGGREKRKELVVLDRMMALQPAEELAEAAGIPGPIVDHLDPAFAEILADILQFAAEAAELIMDMEPETRHLAEIDVVRPNLARIGVEEYPEVVRPAFSGIEVKIHFFARFFITTGRGLTLSFSGRKSRWVLVTGRQPKLTAK